MGGVGNYQVTVEARADGGLSDNANCQTDVAGLADVEFEVLERRRVVDVDETTTFQIRIKNIGTKEATRHPGQRQVLAKNDRADRDPQRDRRPDRGQVQPERNRSSSRRSTASPRARK